MIIIEEYLFYLQENKWKEMLRLGKLSVGKGSALRRIQQYKNLPDKYYVKQLMKDGKIKDAQQYLAQRGIVKSARTWLSGVEKGSNNRIKKMGTKIIHIPDAGHAKIIGAPETIGKDMTNPLHDYSKVSQGGKRSVMHLAVTGTTKKDYPLRTIFKRHETDEVDYAKKLMKKYKGSGDMAGAGSAGGHVSDEILRRERELERSGLMHGNKSGSKDINYLRTATKEKFLKIPETSKEMKKLDKEKILTLKKNMKNIVNNALSLPKEQFEQEMKIGYEGAIKQVSSIGSNKKELAIAKNKIKVFFQRIRDERNKIEALEVSRNVKNTFFNKLKNKISKFLK